MSPEADTIFRGRASSGDPDLDEAMSELDDFLDRDRTATEARERERLTREARAREARARAQAGQSRPEGPPRAIVEAYATLGLPYGAPFAEVKAAYKRLLMQHHPDRNNGSTEAQKRATELSAKINSAYHHLEIWTSTGKVPEDA